MKLTLTLLLGLVFSLPLSATEKIILTTNILKPYQYLNNQQQLTGIAIEPIKCALNLMQQPYEFKVYPWSRAQAYVAAQEAQGFFIASQNAQRDLYATVSIPIINNQWLWYTHIERSFNFQHPNFTTQTKIASIKGTNMLRWLKNEFIHVSAPNDTKTLFLMLDKHRVDVVLLNKDMFESTFTAEYRKRYKAHFARNAPLRAYFENQFLTRHPRFLTRFNDAITHCQTL